jgi:hypothetical protein
LWDVKDPTLLFNNMLLNFWPQYVSQQRHILAYILYRYYMGDFWIKKSYYTFVFCK